MLNLEPSKLIAILKAWLVPLGIALLIVIARSHSFLLFHTLAELFAIIVAILIFVVGWHVYPFTRNHFLMYLGCGYFWISILDLIHTLTYEGMNVISITGANIGTQFWLGSRYIEAFLLLTAPWFLSHSLKRNWTFFSFGLLALVFSYIIFSGLFPTTYVPGEGLTSFKIYSEYLIIASLIAAIFIFLRQRQLPDRTVTVDIVLSIVFTILAELSFTLYIGVFDFPNLLGHIFKFFSFWLIFRAIVRTTLQEPFEAMSKVASTYESIPDATVVVDDNGILKQVNNRACQLAGMRRGELLGKKDHDIFHPSHFNEADCPVCKTIRLRHHIDNLELTIDSEKKIFYSFSVSDLLGISGGHTTVEVIRDISGKKHAEVEFEALNSLKNSIIEYMPSLVFVKEAKELRYVEYNKASEELTGVPRHEMLNKTDFDFWSEEQAAAFVAKDREVLRERKMEEIPQEMVTTRNGTFIMHTYKIPIYSEQGEPLYLVGISENITEKLKIEENLRHSQKMDALGNLTGGVAHDFNNLLSVILGYAELLRDQFEPHEKQRAEYVNEIVNAGDRARKLTSKLLAFARKAPSVSEITNANNLILGIQHMLEKTLTLRIKLDLQLEEELWLVSVDRAGFEDVLLNMCINSMHAMPNGGIIEIKTQNLELPEVKSRSLDLPMGDYVAISIRDTGTGMTEEVRQKIFDPFFSTKGSHGTGLGLSQVYGYMQQSLGNIEVASTVGKGTTITLYFPRFLSSQDTSQDMVSFDELDKPEVIAGGNETILFVDDELALLNIAKEILSGQGYTVLIALNADHALKILNKHKIDLIVSDIIMPGVDGYQLAEQVQKLHPGVKILFASGYSDEEKSIECTIKKLHKPYDSVELLRAVRQLLDNKKTDVS